MTMHVPDAMAHTGEAVLQISRYSCHWQVNDTACTRALRDILLKTKNIAFSTMRAFALTSSRVFSAVILLLSLAPFAVNIVRVLGCLGDVLALTM